MLSSPAPEINNALRDVATNGGWAFLTLCVIGLVLGRKWDFAKGDVSREPVDQQRLAAQKKRVKQRQAGPMVKALKRIWVSGERERLRRRG